MNFCPAHTRSRLLADIGGTHARFAWQHEPGGAITDVHVLPSAEHESLQAAIHAYLGRIGRTAPSTAAIAIASPVTGDRVQMTNHPWSFSQCQVCDEFGFATWRLLNDFTALALALPMLPASDLHQVGGGPAQPLAPVGLVGPGTGLGVSGLLPDGRGGWIPLEGEGGHVTLPAQTPRERLVMDGLVRRYGHASAERLVSGQGLVDTFDLLCEADGADRGGLDTAADLSRLALAGRHAQAVEALDMFCATLGSVAGNLALTLGARGGVYVGGGIVPRLGPALERSAFRQRFEAKGRYQAYLAPIPVWVITSRQSPALIGVSRALDIMA
ncbi:MAG: glucokinase [Gammaproteobacteria bacterium]